VERTLELVCAVERPPAPIEVVVPGTVRLGKTTRSLD
jgi:hypothetical protein